MNDASFADGREKPLNIAALDSDDLKVISALVQDAVFPGVEMRWIAKSRRFAMLLNRFRWELPPTAGAKPERVQSVVAVENVMKVASQGVDRKNKDVILSVLSIDFDGKDDAPGDVTIVLAGDGALRLSVEALEVRLKDVTRPYRAPSGRMPNHPE